MDRYLERSGIARALKAEIRRPAPAPDAGAGTPPARGDTPRPGPVVRTAAAGPP